MLIIFSVQPSVNQYVTVDSGNAANGQIPSDRSVTPLSTDFMDQSFSYLPNGYPSTAYYYGGKLMSEISTSDLFLMDYQLVLEINDNLWMVHVL